MDAQRETLRSLFDAVADSYDQVGVDFFQPIAAGLVAELNPQPGERALDLGCGRGAALLPIAHAVGPTGSVVEHGPLPVDDPTRRRPAIEQARRVLGWTPSTTLEQGLAATIAHFRELVR